VTLVDIGEAHPIYLSPCPAKSGVCPGHGFDAIHERGGRQHNHRDAQPHKLGSPTPPCPNRSDSDRDSHRERDCRNKAERPGVNSFHRIGSVSV
jgi:hypothetical protein